MAEEFLQTRLTKRRTCVQDVKVDVVESSFIGTSRRRDADHSGELQLEDAAAEIYRAPM
jgi:hypothetical protein